MEVGKLTVQHRAKTGKGISRSTRRDGDVPGVCYGFGMDAPVPVTLNVKALKKSFDPAKRRNTVIDVSIEGGDKPQTIKALVWDFQVHPIRQEITHVDIKAIDPDKKVEAVVPVKGKGTHKGAINGGLLSWARHEVKILAKPEEIPVNLVLDVSPVDIGQALHVSDLQLPEGVEFSSSPKLTLVSCIAPKGLKSEKKADEAAPAAPAKK